MGEMKRRDLLRLGLGLAGTVAAGEWKVNAETLQDGVGLGTVVDSVGIMLMGDKGGTVERCARILASRIQERSGIRPRLNGKASCRIHLDIQEGIGREGFNIKRGTPNDITITGNDPRGLLFGVGKFLRSSTFGLGTLAFGDWQGTSIPDMPFRQMYFATHFHNFYEEAPVEEVNRYTEDLALWGYNGIVVWFDMHQYSGMDDPSAQAMIERLRMILGGARLLGLDAGLTLLGNEAYANSPEALRADYTIGHDGYFKVPRGNYPVDLCPNKPGAKDLMLKWREEVFEAFRDVGLDYVTIWPYDQGGCTNKPCAPWGANGFLTMAEPIAKVARKEFPGCRIVLSTWKFDDFVDGEWSDLGVKFEDRRPTWVDYIMAGDDGIARFAGNPPRHQVPGAFPLLGFPEISMWGATPWGGFGANPLPSHHQALWDRCKDSVAGGFPYSEGIFDDLNAVIYSQFYWDKDASAEDTVKEYIAYEFSPRVVGMVWEVVQILEKDYPRHPENLNPTHGPVKFVLNQSADAQHAFEIVAQAEVQLSPRARRSWRWRMLYLRALIDSELASHGFQVSKRCEEAFRELVNIDHAQSAYYVVSPPTAESLERARKAKVGVAEQRLP